ALKQRRLVCFDGDVGVSVLAFGGGAHLAAEVEYHVLQAIADAEYGKFQIEDAGIGDRRVFVVDGRRPAGQDDSDGWVAANLFERRVAGKNRGEDVQFADAARNQLRILRPEVEDDNRLGFHG